MNRSLIFSRLITVFFLTCMMILASLMNAGSIHAKEESPKPDNGLPVVYLYIDESQGTIEDMLASKDHSVYCYGSFSVSDRILPITEIRICRLPWLFPC